MKLPSYPNRETSNYPWLGSFPAHWVVKRLRFATERIEQGWSPQCDNQAADDDAWGVMKVGCVNGDQFDASENKALPPELDPKAEYELRPGDVLISRANTRELVGSAAIVPSGVRSKLLLCDKLFRIDLSPGIDAAYLTYCLRTPAARFQYEQDATGASGSMQNIGQDAIKNLVLPFPSRSEQQQIAAFLDWRTRQIDALIAKKQALLQKLKEKRLAVITQAVTKGLNPDAPMRDSGIAWLGEVPAHWDVVPLGVLITMSGGMTPSMSNSEYWEGEIPWVTPKDMKQSRISDSIDHITEIALAETAISLIPIGAILVVVRGMILAHSFPTAVTERPVTINQDMKALRCGGQLDAEFLFWCLNGFARVISNLAQDSAHGTRKIETETLKKFAFPLPPKSEQANISRALVAQLNQLDQLVAASNQTITRLTEYRSALITAATTGKIDVRNVAIPAHA